MPDTLSGVAEASGAKARMDAAAYETAVRRVEEDPGGYWSELGRRLDWIEPFAQVKDVSFARPDVRIRWFADGVLNAAANCLDRHLADGGDRAAIIWESDDGATSTSLTYRQVHAEVCRWANVLKATGVGKGDRVAVCLPTIPAAAAAMLACARIGAIHAVVDGALSPDRLAACIRDCDSRLVITADEGLRGGRIVPLKRNVDSGLASCPAVTDVIVVRRTGGDVPMMAGRDAYFSDLKQQGAAECPAEPMHAEDALFILYAPASAGRSKGALHTTGGYLAWASWTHEMVFDCGPGEVFWCAVDLATAAGHGEGVYGPLANGATTLMFEGVAQHPNPSRFWEVCEKHKVEVFCAPPSTLRPLMRGHEEWVNRTSRRSIRLLGTVGEPIDAQARLWLHRVVGEGRRPVVGAWGPPGMGSCFVAPADGQAVATGACTLPLPGVKPGLVDADGKPLEGAVTGGLCIMDSWPGQTRTIYGDHQGFIDAGFSTCPGAYFTGETARRDADGCYGIAEPTGPR